jgi:glycopeptide antibiotics resistance protein
VEQTVSYDACFNFSLLTLFISSVIIGLTYMGKGQSFLPYTGIMLGIAVINWLIPSIYCFLRYMLDFGTKIDDFNSFYRNNSIVFFLFYIIVIAYGSLAASAFPWAYRAVIESANFIPFELIATQIEDYLYELIPLSDIITYLLSRILLFFPYGFFITLVLRRQARLPRFFALLFLPFLIEVLQYFVIPSRCDIDDIIYALIGGILGSLSYYLLNVIFRTITGKNFLTKESDYRYSGGSLHF